MTYPKYVVTYVVMTEEAGANPFWHASILMSEQQDANAPLEVKDAFGFYSTYPSSTTNPIIHTLKTWLGFKIDLQDSHGHLEQEKIRFLDGQGLQGISFEVDKKKYDGLYTAYHRAKQLENEAIEEYNALLSKEGKPVNGHYRWLKELEQINQHHREARLYPFHIDWSFSWNPMQFGFTTDMSYTCKNRALDLLRRTDIITNDIHKQISGGRATRAFPRASNLTLTPIQLISTGDRKKEKKHWNRSWENKNHLFWAQKPKLISDVSTIADDLKNENHYGLIKNMLARINEMECLLHKQIAKHQELSQRDEHYRELCSQLEQLQRMRKRFIATAYNQTDRALNRNLYFAEKMLNIARMMLTPEKANYSFLAALLENAALRNAMIGLVFLVATANLLTGPIGILVSTGISLFAEYQLYKAVTEHHRFNTMQNDYSTYHLASKNKIVVDSPSSSTDTLSPLSPTYA
jgi:hypothetical protein